jgi:hypothetical protein
MKLETRVTRKPCFDLRRLVGVARWLLQEHSVRFIFISGNLDEGRRDHLRALDPVAFVGKPILSSRLAEALAQASLKKSATTS